MARPTPWPQTAIRVSTLADWGRWRPGRQGSGYAKLLLATLPWPIGWDAYLLRYRACQGIDWHTDPVPGKRHFRLNIELWRSGRGGLFECEGPVRRWGRALVFRPDHSLHRVLAVESGQRWVLSVGWVLPEAA